MAGTRESGRKAAQTNRQRYDEEYKDEGGFYAHIGRIGGRIAREQGRFFADRTVGPDGLTNAQRAGRAGGKVSRRYKRDDLYEEIGGGQ